MDSKEKTIKYYENYEKHVSMHIELVIFYKTNLNYPCRDKDTKVPKIVLPKYVYCDWIGKCIFLIQGKVYS